MHSFSWEYPRLQEIYQSVATGEASSSQAVSAQLQNLLHNEIHWQDLAEKWLHPTDPRLCAICSKRLPVQQAYCHVLECRKRPPSRKFLSLCWLDTSLGPRLRCHRRASGSPSPSTARSTSRTQVLRTVSVTYPSFHTTDGTVMRHRRLWAAVRYGGLVC